MMVIINAVRRVLLVSIPGQKSSMAVEGLRKRMIEIKDREGFPKKRGITCM